jgi:hypothetical protein
MISFIRAKRLLYALLFIWDNKCGKYEQKLIYVPTSRVPMPVATRSKTSVCGHSLAVITGLDPAEGMDVCLS